MHTDDIFYIYRIGTENEMDYLVDKKLAGWLHPESCG